MSKRFQGLYNEYPEESYPGVGRIYDEDVYKLIKKHSRLIDRMSKTKMVEMSLLGQTILQKLTNFDPDDSAWTFYGKRSLYNRSDW